MATYIQGIGNVSAQVTPQSDHWLWHDVQTNPVPCAEPDYTGLIAPMQLRRMSKVVRMGISASYMALKDASLEKPDVILTGTAYGCLADTENFLTKLIQQEEQMLTPTAFIQSTHNTVSGQIALQLSCHGRNFTYTQRGHSFEHALEDALLSLQEQPKQQILVGAMDEISKHSHPIISRFDTFKKEGESFFEPTKGTFAGEGAQMFVLSNEKQASSYAEVLDVCTCYTDQVESTLKTLLQSHQIQSATCLAGLNGDIRYDDQFKEWLQTFSLDTLYTYKNFCGEQPTAAAFAMLMGASMMKFGTSLKPLEGNTSIPETILIWNHYKMKYHSFILLRKP